MPQLAADDGMRKRPASSSSTPPLPGDHKRQKWVRLLLRELYDCGFPEAAATLEREASVQLCSNGMKALQTSVLNGQWDAALQLVSKPDTLKMKSPLAAREAALLLLQRKFIDFVLQKELPRALQTFQEEILPVYRPSEQEVTQLAELLLCRDAEELKQKAKMIWQDQELQDRIEQLVSAEEIIPHGALRDGSETELQTLTPMLTGLVAGECVGVLTSHKNGDLWELAFSPDGAILASASSDGSVVLWQMQLDEEALAFDQMPQPTEALHVLQSLEGPADCLAWSQDSRFLLSSGSRSSTIQLWDRMWSGRRVLDVVVHPHESKVFVLVSGYEIRVYDIAHKSDELFLEADHLVSCLSMSPCGKFLLLNFVRQEQIACVEISTALVTAKYRGIHEQRYVLRPCFGGAHSELVVSGSEDSKVYLWQRDSGKLAAELDGHSSVVNVVVRHPVHTNVIASASDDKTVRVWSLKSLE
uniref:CTLH domain-containing protein n=1 Tax=Phytophthora ramorum TaxID=164328 RepID=H3GZV7_PHYRM